MRIYQEVYLHSLQEQVLQQRQQLCHLLVYIVRQGHHAVHMEYVDIIFAKVAFFLYLRKSVNFVRWKTISMKYFAG